MHAEQLALRRTGGSKIDTLFVVRLLAEGFGMAHPCKKCMALAKKSGVSVIYFTNEQGKVEKITST